MIKHIITLLICISFSFNCFSQEEKKTIHIEMTGKASIEPNIATFSIAMECIKDTPNQANECLLLLSKKINQDLKKFNIKRNDITTHSINLTKEYKWDNRSKVFEGYKASQILTVTVRDLNSLNSIFPKLLNNDNLLVNNLKFSHTDIDSLRNKAYLDALKKANKLVDELLNELPENQKTIVNIQNVPERKNTFQQARMEMDTFASASSELEINTGLIEIEAILFIDYLINK